MLPGGQPGLLLGVAAHKAARGPRGSALARPAAPPRSARRQDDYGVNAPAGQNPGGTDDCQWQPSGERSGVEAGKQMAADA